MIFKLIFCKQIRIPSSKNEETKISRIFLTEPKKAEDYKHFNGRVPNLKIDRIH